MAVYKTIKILQKKGYLKEGLQKGLQKPYALAKKVYKKLSRYIRLHGVEFNIAPYYKSNFYEKVRQTTNVYQIMDCTIRLYEDSIEVYTAEHHHFNGETVQRATSEMFIFFNKLLGKLENRLRIGIIKNDYCNIRIVNQHYAEVNNEVAKELDKDKIKLTIYGKDGRAWFKIDTSWNFNEAETIHPQMSKQDAQLVFERHLNDWRDNNPMTNSELQGAISNLVQIQKTEVEKWAFYAENIKTHTEAIIELKDAIKEFRKVSNPLATIISKIKSKEDILRYRPEIEVLTTEDKEILSHWLVSRNDFSK